MAAAHSSGERRERDVIRKKSSSGGDDSAAVSGGCLRQSPVQVSVQTRDSVQLVRLRVSFNLVCLSIRCRLGTTVDCESCFTYRSVYILYRTFFLFAYKSFRIH
ncbi:hypothetical protein Hanom_Chr11g01009541 [Helianthus anomalus]